MSVVLIHSLSVMTNVEATLNLQKIDWDPLEPERENSGLCPSASNRIKRFVALGLFRCVAKVLFL